MKLFRKKTKEGINFSEWLEKRESGQIVGVCAVDNKMSLPVGAAPCRPQKNTPTRFRLGISIKITGFNQLKLLAEFAKNHIILRDLTRTTSSKMTLTIHKKDKAKVFAILDKLCYTYEVIKEHSLLSFLKYVREKSALLAAVVLFVTMGFFAYTSIWRLEISGNEKLEVEAIERLLFENGFRTGMRRSSLEKAAIRSLVSSLDEVFDTAVEIRGITLFVTVTESTDHFIPPEGSYAGVFAAFDATITRIVAQSGTPLVERGQRVFQGAALIGAYRLDKEENMVAELAKGEVYGIVTFLQDFNFALSSTEIVRTGNRSTATGLQFFGRETRKRIRHNFEKYEAVTVVDYAFPNFFFPMRVSQTRFYELVAEERVYELEERKQYFINQTLADTAYYHGANEPPQITTLVQEQENGAFRLTVFVQVEMRIGSN